MVNLDKLTYAGNPDNLRAVENDPRYSFVQADIVDREAVMRAAEGVDAIVNFAAETHVDRSITDPEAFLRTDIMGTHTLLEAVRELGIGRMVQVSTDEVYGSVESGSSTEDDPIVANSPYSASKAGGDLQVLAYHRTYGVPVMITRGSNTYGPYQYPEKLIPLFVTNALEGEKLPLYGDGLNVRDWLHVDDHCAGIEFVLEHGEPGQVYNVGGGNERTNLEITSIILDELGLGEDCIRRVPDRPGHDRRYSLNCDRLRAMGWTPGVDFERGLRETVRWYRDNARWWQRIKHETKDFAEWKRRWYEERNDGHRRPQKQLNPVSIITRRLPEALRPLGAVLPFVRPPVLVRPLRAHAQAPAARLPVQRSPVRLKVDGELLDPLRQVVTDKVFVKEFMRHAWARGTRPRPSQCSRPPKRSMTTSSPRSASSSQPTPARSCSLPGRRGRQEGWPPGSRSTTTALCESRTTPSCDPASSWRPSPSAPTLYPTTTRSSAWTACPRSSWSSSTTSPA